MKIGRKRRAVRAEPAARRICCGRISGRRRGRERPSLRREARDVVRTPRVAGRTGSIVVAMGEDRGEGGWRGRSEGGKKKKKDGN